MWMRAMRSLFCDYRTLTGGALVISFLWVQPALTNPITVDQITDLSASGAAEMFRFSPEIVRLEQGGLIEFRNSVGGHTVHSIEELWPSEAQPVAISCRPHTVIQFSEPGVYGLTCKRHGLYGIIMLVIVGDFKAHDLMSQIDQARLSADAKEKLISIAAGAGLID